MKFHTVDNNQAQIQSNQSNSDANDSTITSHRIQIQKSSKKNSKKKCLRWNFEQNIMYLKFLKLYQKKLKSQKNTKKYKKFEKMSQYIGEKNADQCRSHHQKMILRFGSIDDIINQLSNQLKQGYQQSLTECQYETPIQIEENQIQNKQGQQSKGQSQQTIEEQKMNSQSSSLHIQDDDIFDVIDI